MSGRAAKPPYSLAGPRGNTRAANSTFHLRHSFSRLRYQNKSTRTRNPASYAGYYPLDSNVSGRWRYPASELLGQVLKWPGYQAFLTHKVGGGSSRQEKPDTRIPHSVSSVSVCINQSKSFPAVMFTFKKIIKSRPCLPWFPRKFAQFAPKVFAQSMESVSPQYRCFLKFLRKSFLTFCVTEKSVILVELLLRLRIVVIQDNEFDGKGSVCKKKNLL